MHIPPAVLHTERLILRELTLDDAPALARILGDAQVMRHSVRGVLSAQATCEFIHGCVHAYREHGFAPWAVVEKSTSTLAGFCGLNAERVDGVDQIQLGYRLAAAFWGRGLATEAAQKTVDHGFATLQIESLVAIVEPANVASIKVIRKLGFDSFIHSQYHRRGVRIYRMNAQQWSSGSKARG